ncbi:hypothetical protein [Aeromicrobium sp. 179-A 4D2 NHS]|uniref:hypothetical protein n=1 Tax=Aeromicrobium sp. 179-A 4D2 NHS TaxID=3142375 RepID=UPI0039A3C397
MDASDTTTLMVLLCVGLVIYLAVTIAAIVYAVRLQLTPDEDVADLSPHQEDQDRETTDTTVPSEWTTTWPTPTPR